MGPHTEALVRAILESRPHPEQGYRSCLGILRLAKVYGPERLEVACGRALGLGARSYRHVESMLRHGLDRAPQLGAEPTDDQPPAATHQNIRGRNYYH